MLICALLISIESTKVFADENIRVKAIARTVYQEYSDETKEKALYLAKKVALKKFFQRQPKSMKRLLEEFKKEFYKDVDRFVVEVQIQQEKNDEDKGTYAIAIMASIDAGAIKAFFAENSAAGNQRAGDANDFGAMFIARRESERKSFDAKRTSISETDSTQSQEEANASSDTRSSSSSRDRTFDKTTTGGSTSSKKDKVRYEPDLDLSEDIASSIGEHLVDAGFEPMEMDDLDNVPLLDEIKFRKGRLPRRTLRNFKRAAIDAGWTYLGMGTIDIGTPRRDRARGIVKVAAKVSFKVWMLTDGRAKGVATVRPTIVYGSDASDDAGVAETDAYNRAVVKAMNTVVSQLQQKGLR